MLPRFFLRKKSCFLSSGSCSDPASSNSNDFFLDTFEIGTSNFGALLHTAVSFSSKGYFLLRACEENTPLSGCFHSLCITPHSFCEQVTPVSFWILILQTFCPQLIFPPWALPKPWWPNRLKKVIYLIRVKGVSKGFVRRGKIRIRVIFFHHLWSSILVWTRPSDVSGGGAG